jgi:hypothetical protein
MASTRLTQHFIERGSLLPSESYLRRAAVERAVDGIRAGGEA